jgi:hypothetical protein
MTDGAIEPGRRLHPVRVAADRRAEGWDQPVGGYQQMLLNLLDLLPMA